MKNCFDFLLGDLKDQGLLDLLLLVKFINDKESKS